LAGKLLQEYVNALTLTTKTKKLQKLYFFVCLLLGSLFIPTKELNAANYYWIGGTGNWTDLTHWATTSGGTVTYNQIPTAVDDVFFDANSFSATGQTVTVNALTAIARSMNWTGVTNNPTFICSTNNQFRLYGSLTLAANMLLDFDGTFNFIATTPGNTIALSGKVFTAPIYFNGIGGVWTLQDDFATNNLIYHQAGTLNSNGFLCQANQYRSQGAAARALNMGSSEFRLTGNGSVWSISGTNQTINAGTSVINCTGTVIPIFSGGGFTYYDLNFTSTNASTDATIYDNNTFRNVNFTCRGGVGSTNTFNNLTFQNNGNINANNTCQNLILTAGYTYQISPNTTTTIVNNLNAIGNCGGFINIKSSVDGTQANINKATGTINASYLILKDIRGQGGASFNATNSIDLGNNTNWNINATPVTNLYWVGNSGNWNDGNHWALTSGGAPSGCAPSPQTNVFFDANSFTASSTVTLNSPSAYCRNMSWVGALGTPTFAGTINSNLYVNGSLQFIAGMNLTYLGNTYFASTLGANTVTSATKVFLQNVFFRGVASNYSFQDNFTCNGALYLEAGTLSTNSFTANVSSFYTQTNNAKVLNLGASIINITSSSTCWSASSPNFIINAGTSTINFLSNFNVQGNFGTNHTYYDVNFLGTNTNSAAGIIGSNKFRDVLVKPTAVIYGTNTFRNLTFENAAQFQGSDTIVNLTLASGFSYTLRQGTNKVITGNILATGNCNSFIKIQSALLGSTATISKTTGAINTSYLILQDVVATGGAVFNAANSVNLGNNNGWNFTGAATNNLYWIGNSGNWNDGSHWSFTSGGAPSGCSPSPLTNVFFDGNSFTLAAQTVTINTSNAFCRNMNWAGATGNPTLAGIAASDLNIFGSLALINNMIYAYSGNLKFKASTLGNTITTASKLITTNIIFEGLGGQWILQDTLKINNSIFLNAGALNTNSQSVFARGFYTNNALPKALTLGSSILTFNGSSNFWSISPTNFTLNCGTSKIISTSGFFPNFDGGGLTYYDLSFAATDQGYEADIYGNNTFHNVLSNLAININDVGIYNELRLLNDGTIANNNTFNTLILSANYTYKLASTRTQIITNRLQAQGTCTAYLILESTIAGSPAIIRKTVGNVLGFNIHMKDITGNGGATFFAYNSLNLGNNNGWSFTVLPTLLPPNVVTGPASICAGANSVTYSTSPVSGAIYYEWSVPPGATIVSGQGDTTIIVNFGTASSGAVSVLTFNGCNYNTTGNTLTVVIGPSTAPTVSISANPTGMVCTGNSITYTATTTNTGSNTVTYNFFVNGQTVQSGAAATYLYSNPVNGATVQCNITTTGSNACSNVNTASSNVLTVTINNTLATPNVTLAASSNNAVCAGTAITFTATATNTGGGSISYNFWVDGTSVQNNNSNSYTSSSLTNGQVVSCVINISNGACLTSSTATSNSITTTILPIPNVSINVVPTTTNICAGSNVTFTATATNGGGNPIYQWQVNNTNVGSNSTQFNSATLQNNDVVTCSVVSNATCASSTAIISNSINIQVTAPVTPTITIASNVNNVCAGTNIVFTATANNTGATPTYQWKINGTNVGTNSATYASTSFSNQDVVTCTLTSLLTCLNANNIVSNSTTLTILPPLVANITITASANNICSNTAVTFTATTTNAGNAPVFQWKINGSNVGTNNNIFTSNVLQNNDVVSCTLLSNLACVSSTPVVSNNITMAVSAVVTPSSAISSSANNICNGASVTFNATSTNGGNNPVYQWRINNVNVGNNSTQYISSSLQNGDVVTCTLFSNANCISQPQAQSNSIVMNVITEPTPTVTINTNNNNICSGQTANFNAIAINANTNPLYSWQLNGTPTGLNANTLADVNVNNSDVITCSIIPTAGCFAGNSFTSNNITMQVNPNPIVNIAASANTILFGNEVSLVGSSSTSVNNITWSATQPINNGANLSIIVKPQETSYYFLRIVDNNNCEGVANINIRVLKGIYFPNTFTPNTDGLNDIFRIPVSTAIEKLQYFIIYNRFGEKIFETNNITKGWDGKIRGSDAPTGSYVYIIKAKDINGEVLIKGTVMLVR
jgi:gliding motility-associated-like protein